MSQPPPYGYPVVPVQTQVLVQPYRCSTAHVVVAWVLAVLTGGYLLPWAIGATRNRSNVAAIALVDLLLGWTLVGWVVALVMACGSDRPVVLVQHAYAPAAWAPPAPVAPAVWSPPVAPAPEPTRVDLFGSEPTRRLDVGTWERPVPYDPPAYGPGSDDRR